MSSKREKRIKEKVCEIPVFVVLLVLALLVIIPVIWMTFSAFKPEKEIISWPPTFFPHVLTGQNFVDVQKRINILRYMLNSAIYAGGTTALAVIVNSMAGYAYAFYDFKGKSGLFLLTLATMMVPFQVIMVPLFLVVFKLGMYDSYWGLIIPRVVVAGSIFMMRAAFTGLPKELAEAARIDGLSEFGIFRKIMLPQAKPALATLVIFTFIQVWNDYMAPLIYLNSKLKYTIQLGLKFFQSEHTMQYTIIMAGTVCSLIPILIVFLLFEKQITNGMVHSGLKG